MANRRSHFWAILLLLLFLSGGPCQERCQKLCSGFNFGALSMLFEPRQWVNVGLPAGSNGILHLSGNFPESTVVGLRVGSLANEEVLSVLLVLRAYLSVPRCHFRQYFHQRGHVSSFRSNLKHSSGLCHVSILQLGQFFQVPFRVPLLRLLPH